MPHQSQFIRHWIILGALFIVMTATYWCYDLPGSINLPLQSWLGVDYATWQYSLNALYSVYSIPNIFLPLAAGWVVDVLSGVNRSSSRSSTRQLSNWSTSTAILLLFSGCVLIGQSLFTLGVSLRSFPCMLIGRLIFGLGSETLEVTQAKITTDWFQSSGSLGLALGLHLSFARAATGANDNVSPWITAQSGAPVASFFGAGLCVISFCASIFVCWMDSPQSRRAAGVSYSSVATPPCSKSSLIASNDFQEDKIGINDESEIHHPSSAASPIRQRASVIHEDSDGENHPLLSGHPKLTSSHLPILEREEEFDEAASIFVDGLGENMDESQPPSPLRVPGNTSLPLDEDPIIGKDFFPVIARTSTPNNKGKLRKISHTSDDNQTARYDNDGYESEEFDEGDETIHLSQWSGFKPSFWILLAITLTIYGSAVPFFHICTDFFQSKWYPNDPQSAGFAMSIPDIVSAIGSPICGWLIDRYGRKGILLPVSGALIFAAYLLMTFTHVSPNLSMSLIGLSYSFFAAVLWPCVPLLVQPHQIATGYGFLTVALNLSLFIFPLVVARIRALDVEHFESAMYFFLILSGLSIFFSIWLNAVDFMGDGVLNRAPAQPSVDGDVSESGEVKEDEQGLMSDYDDIDERHESGSEHDRISRAAPSRYYTVSKVVGDGLVIAVPATIVHHHHFYRMGNRYGTDGRSPSPSARLMSRSVPVRQSSRHPHHHPTQCHCFERWNRERPLARDSSPGRMFGRGQGDRSVSPIRRNHRHRRPPPDAEIFDLEPPLLAGEGRAAESQYLPLPSING